MRNSTFAAGKCAAGFIDMIRKGQFEKGANVLFLHTSGSPALFAYEVSFERPCREANALEGGRGKHATCVISAGPLSIV